MKGKLAAAFLAAALIATSSSARDLPSWVFDPPRLDNQLTATGTGDSLGSAKLNAIGALLHTLSSTVSSEQQLNLSSSSDHADAAFQQNVVSQSLKIDLDNVVVSEHIQDGEDHIVQISLAKALLVKSLRDQLKQYAILQVPEGTLPHQYLWALKHREDFPLGLRYERVLAALGSPNPEVRQQLENLNEMTQKLLAKASVRIVAGSELDFLKPVLSRQLPAGGNERIWLKADVRKLRALRGNLHRMKQVVSLQLMNSEAPFDVLATSQLTGEGAGTTAALAEQDAQQQILTRANQPIAQWFFE